MKKLTLFYRIAIGVALIFLVLSVFTKVIIWTAASVDRPPTDGNIKAESRAIFFPRTSRKMYKYTATELRQTLFNQADQLFTPAFLLFFIILIVKLIKTPNLFQEGESIRND